MQKPLVIGNWKMQRSVAESKQLAVTLREEVGAITDAELVVCPSFTALGVVRTTLAGSMVQLGAQDMGPETRGAFTGAISPDDLVELGCRYVILGHSERRNHFGETDVQVQQKTALAVAQGLQPVICVGESAKERATGQSAKVVRQQVTAVASAVATCSKIIIAYEPVWAIGSGTPASTDDAVAMRDVIRETLMTTAPKISAMVIYGGSVTSSNVTEFVGPTLLDGVLPGGASLDAREFRKIARNAIQAYSN